MPPTLYFLLSWSFIVLGLLLTLPLTAQEGGSSYLHRGNIIHNGRAVFPVGYWTENATVADKLATLEVLGPAKFDFVTYGVSVAKRDSLLLLFDRAKDYDVRFVYGLFGGNAPITPSQNPLFDWVLQDTGRVVRDNPALLGYYHSDDVVNIASNELLRKNEVVKRVAPNHLTFQSTGVATQQDSLVLFGESADVLGLQMYPAPGYFPHNVHYHSQRTVAATAPYNHSAMAIGQTTNVPESLGRPSSEGRFPTTAETDVYTYLSLAAGVKSLFFYSYGRTGGTVNYNIGGLAEAQPALWQKTVDLRQEIATLERVLLYGKRSTNAERTFTTYFGRWIYGDKVYVAAINSLIEGQPLPRTNTGVTAETGRQPISIALPAGTVGPARPLFGKGNSLSVSDGTLSGVLDLTTVELYELDYTAPIVGNGDFETGLSQWTAPPNTTLVTRGDNRLLRVGTPTEATSISADLTHRILPERTYTLSADLQGSAAARAVVFVQLRDYRGKIIYVEALPADSPELKRQSLSFTTPAEFGSAVVGVWRSSGGVGDAFVDNISISPAASVSSPSDETPARLSPAGEVQLYPNPATEEVTITTDFRADYVAVYDLQGRRLLDRPAFDRTVRLNVAGLPPGFYLVRIGHAGGEVTRKLQLE